MSRILTGIQSSGRPHLGNLLGAIIPAINLSKQSGNESFFFIADLHSLINIKEAKIREENTRAVAAAWLAFGFDTEKNLLYRQSKIPVVAELAWYLNCFTPYPMLANAHAFKEKSDKLADVNAGLFTYPVLMTADILLYNANDVPVGKDQRQHVEIARDLATTFNNLYGETFVVPEAKIEEHVMTVPGTDGQKMSKSYKNIIDIFLPEKDLRKQVMSIVTDSTPMETPKNPDADNVFAIYQLIGNQEQTASLRQKYVAGNFGYGHAKQELYELILTKYKTEREAFNHYMVSTEMEEILTRCEARASEIANQVIVDVRKKLGF